MADCTVITADDGELPPCKLFSVGDLVCMMRGRDSGRIGQVTRYFSSPERWNYLSVLFVWFYQDDNTKLGFEEPVDADLAQRVTKHALSCGPLLPENFKHFRYFANVQIIPGYNPDHDGKVGYVVQYWPSKGLTRPARVEVIFEDCAEFSVILDTKHVESIEIPERWDVLTNPEP